MIRVLVWNEFYHEQNKEHVREIYPDGIHGEIAKFLGADEEITVRTATLDDENCGITKEILDETDVLIWWGHVRHKLVPDEVAYLVRDAVLEGMGAIFLHSAHHSKPFRYLLGTSCNLTWRESGDSEILWVTEPSHPITRDIDRFFTLEHEETYGEPFVIPTPDKLLLISSFSGGEVFRSGCLYERGNGKIFYFQPGHETFPTFKVPEVQSVIKNAVHFVAPSFRREINCPHVRKYNDPEGYVIVK
ncbi:MAG: trehalose utilization protein ThuA [Ruminococcaceae bacterium]|nr:trehalose utilization protein ThuA [Oscillospiraceae bacterium]